MLFSLPFPSPPCSLFLRSSLCDATLTRETQMPRAFLKGMLCPWAGSGYPSVERRSPIEITLKGVERKGERDGQLSLQHCVL